MGAITSFIRKIATPAVTVQTKDVQKILGVMLNDRDSNKVIHHIHCVACRGKMLPAMTRVYYCMTCRVAVSNEGSTTGIHFIFAVLGKGHHERDQKAFQSVSSVGGGRDSRPL